MEKIAPERYTDVNGETSMAADPIRKLFTTHEYHTMVESGILSEDDRVELIEGEIWQMSPIGPPHASRVARLDRMIQRRLEDGQAIVCVQGPIHLDDLSEPQPDLALLHFREDFYASALPTPSDIFLVIEVSDTTARHDRQVKMGLYSRHRLPEAWLVDIPRSVLEVYRDPSPQGYREVLTLRRGDRISPLAFPDLNFDVDAILG
ncbi:MAG: Uma2 family endonuclease [Thermoanaerobaculia bacterium]